MRFYKALAVFLVLFLMCGLSSAKVVLLSLDEMISKSELIIVGTVTKIRETGMFHKDLKQEYKATIVVEEAMKGGASGDIEIYFYPEVSTEPEFSINERCILFVKTREGKHSIVQGYSGKVLIKNDSVQPLISGEAQIQEFTPFKNRIIAHTR